MAKGKQKKENKNEAKKIYKAIEEKLAGVLADYKKELGEKKFTTRIKKASKLFSRGVGKLNKKAKEKGKKQDTSKLELVQQPMIDIK
jgi:hypothetical protein